MIQLIDKQHKTFTLLIHGIECNFIPMNLYIGNNLYPVKSFVRGARLYWKIAGKQVSYNQIKAAIGVSKSIKNRVIKVDPILKLWDEVFREI